MLRQTTAFSRKSPRISKQRFTSQVDVNNDLSKPVTPHYLPKERESAVAKPHHMIAPGSSRYSSNDMVHKHYLEEAKKKTQESSRNSEPSMMPSARSQSTANGSKPKPRIHNQKSRNWPASKSSCVTTKTGFKEFSSDEQVMTSDHNSSELGIHDHSNELSSSKLVPKVVPPADKTATSRQELELLYFTITYHAEVLRIIRVILPEILSDIFSIHYDDWKSFQCHHQTGTAVGDLRDSIESSFVLNGYR
ncbi:hypothetical protein Tco_0706407 [Tanacetum coccineum]|uniref:Uncharacterized protein n=1 Tax=Tanacetum coccineum TaxID=301880 RepID=A0ABQ4Y899_9ASTR